MKKNKKKCPVCGEKLQPMYGKLMCPSCGYSAMPDNAMSENTYSSSSSVNMNMYNNQQNSTGQSQSMFNYNDDHMNNPSGQNKKGMQPISNKSMKSILISAGVLMFWGIFVFSMLRHFDYDDKYNSYSYENVTFPTYSFQQGNTSSSQNNSSQDKDKNILVYPQSELFLNLIEEVFDKEYTDITEAELNSVVSIRISKDDDNVSCGLSDGTMHSYSLSGFSYYTKDLSCFKGLEYIDVDAKISSSDIKNLTKLKGIFSKNTIKDFVNIIPSPENIVSLGSYEDFSVTSLDGLEEFKNLVQLYIASSHISDISVLKKLTGLEYLCLEDAGSITDFTPITYLTSLEVFDITSSKLKNLSFLDSLDNITEFSLRKSRITDISALEKYKSSLTKLCLSENYDVADYSAIGEFTGLTELEICADANAVMPDLSKNTDLEILRLDRAYDLSMLRTVSNISELYLRRCYLEEMPDLSHLTDLYYLRIDESLSLITNLTPVTTLPALECLDISNTKVYGNIEEIFDIPTLFELYMDNCNVSIDFSKVQENENLDVLSMNNITVMKYNLNEYGSIDIQNATKVDINEGLGFFLQKFPYLSELYIAGNGIKNLDFVSYLPYLWAIDVSDNYISSLSPLKNLSDLVIVWCKDNTITDGYDLGENVYVVTK